MIFDLTFCLTFIERVLILFNLIECDSGRADFRYNDCCCFICKFTSFFERKFRSQCYSQGSKYCISCTCDIVDFSGYSWNSGHFFFKKCNTIFTKCNECRSKIKFIFEFKSCFFQGCGIIYLYLCCETCLFFVRSKEGCPFVFTVVQSFGVYKYRLIEIFCQVDDILC